MRPVAAHGTSVTPGNNTKGTYAQIFTGAEVANDVFGVLININSGFVAAAIKDALIDIGVDPAGGTAYTVLVPDLATGGTYSYTVAAGGSWFYFPIWIKAGSTIAARASTNNATPGTVRVLMCLYGKPRHPSLVRVGTYVTSVGVVAATSRGTVVVPGTTSEGAWTSLGTPTKEHWFWQTGGGVGDTTATLATIHGDLAAGDATNKRIILEDERILISASEEYGKPLHPLAACYVTVPANVEIWARLQSSTTVDTNHSVAAYGVGG